MEYWNLNGILPTSQNDMEKWDLFFFFFCGGGGGGGSLHLFVCIEVKSPCQQLFGHVGMKPPLLGYRPVLWGG